jgi:hypothetical protein
METGAAGAGAEDGLNQRSGTSHTRLNLSDPSHAGC